MKGADCSRRNCGQKVGTEVERRFPASSDLHLISHLISTSRLTDRQSVSQTVINIRAELNLSRGRRGWDTGSLRLSLPIRLTHTYVLS
jgi:hypothetical protein